MRRCCDILLVMLFFTAVSVQAEPLAFAPLPMQNREALYTQFGPMVHFLEESLGEPIEFVFCDSYQELLDQFAIGNIDLAYLGPLPYILLKKQTAAATPLVHFLEESGQASYSCAVVMSDEKPTNFRNATGLTFALTEPLSTCGFLFVESWLRKNGSSLKHNRHVYEGRHDAVIRAVLRGEAQAGGVKTALARKYAHLGLRIVDESAAWPSFALVGNAATLSREQLDGIGQALLAKQETRGFPLSWGDNIRHGVRQARDSDYDRIRVLLEDTSFDREEY